MEDMRFATLRLGKTSVDEIKRMDKSSPGIVATDFNISVKCTQVPPDLNSGTYHTKPRRMCSDNRRRHP